MVFGINVDKVKHYLCKIRIELCSDALYKFLTDQILGDRITIASLGGHRVVCVCDGDYTCDLRYILALESVRVPVSVIAFMVMMSAYAEIRRLTDT